MLRRVAQIQRPGSVRRASPISGHQAAVERRGRGGSRVAVPRHEQLKVLDSGGLCCVQIEQPGLNDRPLGQVPGAPP